MELHGTAGFSSTTGPPTTYDTEVALGPQTVQLRPTPHCRTPILSYTLAVTPAEHVLRWQLDPHANYAARVLFAQQTREFSVDVKLVSRPDAHQPLRVCAGAVRGHVAVPVLAGTCARS